MKWLNILLIFSVLTGSCIQAEAKNLKPSIHVILNGKVSDQGGKGIADVSVTDGTNIVRTNAQGEYRLESTNEARFVYITVPSGYEIPTDNYIASFYRKIEAKNGLFTSNFTLNKSKVSDKKHYAILWSDPQIQTSAHVELLEKTAVPDTRDHIRELLKSGPVVGLAAGDIVGDAPQLYPEYKKAVKNMGAPFFQVLGNHDMNIYTRSDEKSDSTFQANFGPSWYSFNRGDAHYIVLDNIFYFAKGYNYIGYITEKQLKWLEQDLAYVKPGSLVFVSMHISAYTNEKKRNNLQDDIPGNITSNRKYLFNMLRPFKAHLLTGHTHFNETHIEDGVFEHIHGSVCAAWWTGPLCEDGTPGGYGVYEVDGTDVKWYYKSIGKPKDYQMRVYTKGTYKDRPADIAVNVWNYDEAWKVNWYEDGKLQGEMKQETALDAQTIRQMENDKELEKYGWIKPGLTDHLFFATPSAKAKKIRIETIDRFGKKYSEEFEIPGPELTRANQ